MAYVEPKTETEILLVELLQTTLGVERVGVEDNFFDLGATSLKLMDVHRLLQERLGKVIQPLEIFNHPTAAQLAAHLDGGAAASEAPPERDRTETLQRGQSRLQRRLQQRRGAR